MAVEKIVSITGDNIDQSVTLMFAIAPPTVDFQGIVPVVLKVFSLNGTDTITWKWTDVTIACRVEITSHSGACTCDVYQFIPAGQTSNLELRNGYSISTPTSYPGTNARMVNLSGRPADMGSGFITDISTMDEAAYPVLVYRHVANSNAAYINYTPILKVWATADYEEGQLLDSNIPALPELWSGDLSAMMGLEVPLIVSRDKSSGKIAMTLKGFASPPNPDTPRSQRQTVLKADLAFASPGLVADGVNAISKLLLNKGYTIKTFSKAGSNTEIHIDLTLPQTVNCNEAELHMLAALQASPTVHGKVFVKGRSGVTLLTASPGLESWAEINPASPQWFGI